MLPGAFARSRMGRRLLYQTVFDFDAVQLFQHGLRRYGRPRRGYYDWRMESCAGWSAELEEDDLTPRVGKRVGERPQGNSGSVLRWWRAFLRNTTGAPACPRPGL